MVQEKTYIGKIAAVSKEVRTTSRPGLFQTGFKGTDGTWYNLSESKTVCEAFLNDVLEAKNKGNTVKVDYEDNEWHNIIDHDFDFKESESKKRGNVTSHPKGGQDPETEKEMKHKAHREQRTAHMTECLEDALKVVGKVHPMNKQYTPDELAALIEVVKSVGITFFIEDKRRGY